jgi:hypothetical protein
LRKSNILAEITVPDYMEYIQLSKARRPVYYKKGTEIPKKYTDNDKFDYDKAGRLIGKEDGKPLIKNKKTVGNPRMKKISGQDIWSGALHPQTRARIAKDLKKFFKTHYKDVEKVSSDDYPVGVKLDFYKPIGIGNWDIDNHSLIYRKVIMDSLKDLVIEDDSVTYVRSIPCNYYDCSEAEKRIVITIFKLT